MLDRLAGNLIENAIRYNHLMGKLWLRTENVGGQARLVVGSDREKLSRQVLGVAGGQRSGQEAGRRRERARRHEKGLSLSMIDGSVSYLTSHEHNHRPPPLPIPRFRPRP